MSAVPNLIIILCIFFYILSRDLPWAFFIGQKPDDYSLRKSLCCMNNADGRKSLPLLHCLSIVKNPEYAPFNNWNTASRNNVLGVFL